MSELFLRTLLIGLATSVGSYFIIKFLHKHLRQTAVFLGVAVFVGLFGYGIYQENKTQNELDDAISKISKELDSITKDNALHDLIKRTIAKKDGVSLLRSILPFSRLTRFTRLYCRIQIIRS